MATSTREESGDARRKDTAKICHQTVRGEEEMGFATSVAPLYGRIQFNMAGEMVMDWRYEEKASSRLLLHGGHTLVN